MVRRMVRRLSAWEIQPIVDQLNALRAASLEVTQRMMAAEDERRSTGTH
jgi:hypothetical protein